MSFIVVIPARFQSVRLPGKPLLDIAGKPMIQHVYERACQSQATEVYIATDNEDIQVNCEAFGAKVCMTDQNHASGSDRIEEVTRILELKDDDVVVNVQGDEPLIPPAVINQVADNLLNNSTAGLCSLYENIEQQQEIDDPNAVKVVTDKQGMALYFSRAAIPFNRDKSETVIYKRHIGLYAYRVKTLHDFVSWPMGVLETQEKLEQLRFMENGIKIHMAPAIENIPPGVDTEADLKHIKDLLENN
jgi:3-deoxy-manno-octulosonate cytidylyltransferase (CMP-KDO synthetase)